MPTNNRSMLVRAAIAGSASPRATAMLSPNTRPLRTWAGLPLRVDIATAPDSSATAPKEAWTSTKVCTAGVRSSAMVSTR